MEYINIKSYSTANKVIAVNGQLLVPITINLHDGTSLNINLPASAMAIFCDDGEIRYPHEAFLTEGK